MRERLTALLVGVTLVVITLYGVPRAYFVADLVREQQQEDVARSVTTVAAALSVQQANDIPVTESFLAQTLGDDDAIVYVAPDGSSTEAGDIASTDSDIVRSAAVAGGGRVTVTRSGEVVADRVADALLPLVILGLALLVASAVAGLFIARRLSRPFTELAGVATSLGQGRFDEVVPQYSIPEAEAIAGALRTSATQLDRLVRREREFTVNASHVLLTPITALNLQLEDLKAWPETPRSVAEELQAALEILDQLTGTVRGLLEQDRSARRTRAREVDLSALTEHVVERWRPSAAEQHREVRFESTGVVAAHLEPDEVTQVLDALLDNACRHGRGTITVDCAELETHLRVRVGDEGPSDARRDVLHRDGGQDPAVSSGGLEAAAELAEAQGGYLVRDDSPTTRFVLMLTKPEPV